MLVNLAPCEQPQPGAAWLTATLCALGAGPLRLRYGVAEEYEGVTAGERVRADRAW